MDINVKDLLPKKSENPKPKPAPLKYYNYTGINVIKNRKVKGILGAVNEDDLREKLTIKSIQLETYELRDNSTDKFIYASVNTPMKPGKRDIAMFFDNLAFLLDAGLQNMEALSNIMMSSPNKYMKIQAIKIMHELQNGRDLAQAMQATKFYDKATIAQIRAGLESGDLVNALQRVSQSLERELSLRSKIISAASYPCFVIVIVFVLVAAMLTLIVPTMMKSIIDMGAEIPKLTQIVLDLSDAFVQYGPLILLVIITIALTLYTCYKKIGAFELLVDKFILKVPLFGTIVSKINLSRFCLSFAALQACNIETSLSLEITRESITNRYLRDGIHTAKDLIALHGYNLIDAMKKARCFPYDLLSMVGVGVSAGSLVEVCNKVSKRYEEEVDALIKRMSSMIEPLMILIIGATVGVIVIAMYLPMFGMMDTL